jgi:hypothetical protein
MILLSIGLKLQENFFKPAVMLYLPQDSSYKPAVMLSIISFLVNRFVQCPKTIDGISIGKLCFAGVTKIKRKLPIYLLHALHSYRKLHIKNMT